MYGNDEIRNPQDALKYMKKAADKSCERSMCELGKMLSNDIEGIEKNIVKSKDYFKKVYKTVMFMYSKSAINGIGFDKPNIDDAELYLKMSADSSEFKYIRLYNELCET